jgi:hypothetical protein
VWRVVALCDAKLCWGMVKLCGDVKLCVEVWCVVVLCGVYVKMCVVVLCGVDVKMCVVVLCGVDVKMCEVKYSVPSNSVSSMKECEREEESRM